MHRERARLRQIVRLTATPFPLAARDTQRGVALLVALILLVVITMVGLAAIGTTILQNKAAANAYDRQIAFQSSEAALRQAQVDITAHFPTPGAPGSQGLLANAGFEDCSTPTAPPASAPNAACQPNPFTDPGAAAFVKTVKASDYDAGSIAAGQPQYVVQYMGQFAAPPSSVQCGSCGTQGNDVIAAYYRITARSGDPNKATGRAVVTLQSVFRN